MKNKGKGKVRKGREKREKERRQNERERERKRRFALSFMGKNILATHKKFTRMCHTFLRHSCDGLASTKLFFQTP